jgi:hypothetical protein
LPFPRHPFLGGALRRVPRAPGVRFTGPGRPRQGDPHHHGGGGHREGRTGHHFAQMTLD